MAQKTVPITQTAKITLLQMINGAEKVEFNLAEATARQVNPTMRVAFKQLEEEGLIIASDNWLWSVTANGLYILEADAIKVELEALLVAARMSSTDQEALRALGVFVRKHGDFLLNILDNDKLPFLV